MSHFSDSQLIRNLTLAALLVAASVAATAQAPAPLTVTYTKPGVDITQYKEFRLLPLNVADTRLIPPAWVENPDPKEWELTRENTEFLVTTFARAVREGIESGGKYKVVNDAGPATLQLEVRLISLTPWASREERDATTLGSGTLTFEAHRARRPHRRVAGRLSRDAARRPGLPREHGAQQGEQFDGALHDLGQEHQPAPCDGAGTIGAMGEPIDPAWARHFDTIGDELLRLTTVCGVNLREPGVVERIVKGDETVCSKKNSIGFRKLRDLVMATFSSLNKAADRIGPEETKAIVDALMERLDRQRELGGTSETAHHSREQTH